MPSRPEAPPTADEIVLRTVVGGVGHARGTLRATQTGARINWASGGPRPVWPHLEPGVEHPFRYEAPGRWRVDGPSGPVLVVDGDRAVAWSPAGPVHGRPPVGPWAPGRLLEPDLSLGRARDLIEDQLLGRRCWRVRTGTATAWVDDETAVLLRVDDDHGTLELTALDLDAPVDPADFALPEPAPEPPAAPAATDRPVPPEAAEAADVTVPRPRWWPHGVYPNPLSGDPDTGAVLLALPAADAEVWLAVAPAGTLLPEAPGENRLARTLDGGRCVLSSTGSLDDPERVLASVPQDWSGW